MATIEARAEEFAKKICGCNICEADRRYCPCEEFEENIEKYTEIATEQDGIARAEERERCICIAQGWYCKVACANKLFCKPDYNERCVILEGIRKSMEMQE